MRLKKQPLTKDCGRPAVPSAKISTIARLLTRKASMAAIMKAVGLSKSTVNRVRADYNAVTYETALRRVGIEGEMLRDREYRVAETRARKVPPRVRTAIIQGIANAIKLKDLLAPAPSDPHHMYAPQVVEPEHAPVLLRGKR